ncbi:hypothetical protein Tco_1051774, partial [Tanacetum coccineum]
DLRTIIDSRLTQVVLERPFVEISKLNYDHSEGIIRFTHKRDKVAFECPKGLKSSIVSLMEKEKFKAFFVERSNDMKKGIKHITERRKRYYKDCLKLGLAYRKDKETIENSRTIM